MMSEKSSVAATDVPTPRTSGNYNTCGYLATPPIMQMPSASRATAQSRVLLFFLFICASPSAHTRTMPANPRIAGARNEQYAYMSAKEPVHGFLLQARRDIPYCGGPAGTLRMLQMRFVW